MSSKVADQADTTQVSIRSIMRSPAFRRGVEEYRARKRPDFDCGGDDWNYERGRQFAAIAPHDLSITSPLAVKLFERSIL
jgi:hypothetical protein